ncbi:Hypothetical protein CAP_3256 [Chondromyces apiculatus DSM 436]|uniref:Uncharacterized protein n=1 Tax=Chondromyces apiculatus DSM 436 TaxID=1192034 RepID=A0A017T7W7_9BACT|nr:Hypothetical protein CAP_3256 [Chondromyces apiculatus DSM 436]
MPGCCSGFLLSICAPSCASWQRSSEGAQFQSTSPSGEEDDMRLATTSTESPSFNPRPPRARRTTGSRAPAPGAPHVSIHVPLGRGGRPGVDDEERPQLPFQSTSPSGEEDDV